MSPPGPLSPRSVVSDVPKSPTGHAARKKPFDHLAPPLPPPPSLLTAPPVPGSKAAACQRFVRARSHKEAHADRWRRTRHVG